MNTEQRLKLVDLLKEVSSRCDSVEVFAHAGFSDKKDEQMFFSQQSTLIYGSSLRLKDHVVKCYQPYQTEDEKEAVKKILSCFS